MYNFIQVLLHTPFNTSCVSPKVILFTLGKISKCQFCSPRTLNNLVFPKTSPIKAFKYFIRIPKVLLFYNLAILRSISVNVSINAHRVPCNKVHLQKFQENNTFANTLPFTDMQFLFFRLLFIFNLSFKFCHWIFLTKNLLVIGECEMSDFLNLMQEPQKFFLPQAFKKIKFHFSFSKKLEILCSFSSVHQLTPAYWFPHTNTLL